MERSLALDVAYLGVAEPGENTEHLTKTYSVNLPWYGRLCSLIVFNIEGREKKSYHDPLSGLEWERLCQQGIDKYQYLRQETLERRIGSTVDDSRHVRGVRFVLRDIKPPLGMYWKSRIVWSEPMGEAKDGFDCTNIRFSRPESGS